MNLTLLCGCECVILVHGRGDSVKPWGMIVLPCAGHKPSNNSLLYGEDQERHDDQRCNPRRDPR